MQMDMTSIPENLKAAVGRTVMEEDTISAAPVASLMATFGLDHSEIRTGDQLPPLWHGLFCNAKLPPDRLGVDGLARDEGLLPAAIDYPNKLFGGARFDFRSPLHIGDRIRKESQVMSFDFKNGRSGGFIVCLVQHRVSNDDGLAIVEDNNVIFRPASPTAVGVSPELEAPPLPHADLTCVITPDPILMFRHSALTFNSHRVHYDRNYVVERGYPGLLVQGTLIARLMLNMLSYEKPDFTISEFSFRSGKPVYDTGDITLGISVDGDTADFWAAGSDGFLGMTAYAVREAIS